MPGVKVHSATSAHRNGVGRPYELQLVGTDQVLTTLVENEAQASQIVTKLPGKAAYTAEADGYRISYRPARVDPLEQLIQRHSMHVTGPHGTHLYDRLNFGPGAIVTVGDPCIPPDGVHSGGIAIDVVRQPGDVRPHLSRYFNSRSRMATGSIRIAFPTTTAATPTESALRGRYVCR